MNIKSTLLYAILSACALFAGCATIPQSQATLHTPMKVRAVTKVFAANLQNCSGTISGNFGEHVIVTHNGSSVILGLRSSVGDKVLTFGTSYITDSALQNLYTISPDSGGGSVVFVKPNISRWAAGITDGDFTSPSENGLKAAKMWLAGDNGCS